MVDKITVNPGEVRGAGNIVSPKSLSDFSCYASKLSAGTESVNGANMTVYTEQYLPGTFFWGTYIPRFVPYTGQESFNVPTSLTNSDTFENISGATVKCYVNNELLSTDTTDSNGDVEFTIPISDSVNIYNIKLTYDGDNTNAGCFLSRKIVVGDVEDLDLIAESDITQTGETDQLLATLSGVGVDGEIIGIPGQSVSLYESWTPGLRVSAPIVQSGDVANINAQLVDAVDGSLVRESGETIRVYEEWTPGLKILAPNIIQSADTVNATVQLVDTVDGSYVRESGHTVNVYITDAPSVPTRLSVIFDKTVLSYVDGDSAYGVVKVLDQFDNIMPNQSVSVSRSDGVSWTVETDMYGQGSFSYVSQGDGDVTFTFECEGLSESVTIEDCIYFHDMTSADSSHWTIPENTNASYSSNGMKFSGPSFCDAYLEVPLTKPYSVEFDLTEWSGSPNFLHYFWDSTKTTRHITTSYNNSKTSFDVYPNANNSFDGGIPQGSHIKIEIGNDVCKLYVDDTLKLTKSYTMPSSSILGLAKSGSCPITRKNIKIKPL